MSILFHYNSRLQHQCDHAHAFIKGCKDVLVTDKPDGDADIHIISGPHFAYNQWKHHDKVLMIDRAYWGDPDCVSIAWLQPDGTRKFASGEARRDKPTLYEWKPTWSIPSLKEIRCIVLADYGQDVTETVKQASKRFPSVQVRLHPADCKEPRPLTLEDDVKWADVIVGHSSSALFEAIRYGTPVICTDPNNPVMPVSAAMHETLYRGDRSKWLHDMSYKQFSLSEIADGTAWELLKNVL